MKHISQSLFRRRSRLQPVAVAFLCVLGLSACASDNKVEQAWNQDKQAIQGAIQQVEHKQQQTDSESQRQASALLDVQSRLDTLEQKNELLGKESKTQQAQIDALTARIAALQRNKVKKAERKLKRLAKETKKKPVPKRDAAKPRSEVIVPKPIATAPAPKVDQAAVAEAEKNAYTSAYLALKSGRFDEAGKAFNAQLDKYPAGEYADQAWYWLGETRFAQNDTGKALNAFKYVADHYPDSVKHAAALLKLGQLSEMKQHWQTSLSYYKRLISDHADSSLAEQAREAVNRVQPRIKQRGE